MIINHPLSNALKKKTKNVCIFINKLWFHRRSSSSFFCIFSFVFASSFCATFSSSVNDELTIFVHFQFDNRNFRGVNANINWSTIGFFTLNPFNVDAEFLAIALDDLANLLTFIMSANHLNFVIFPDGNIPEKYLQDAFKFFSALNLTNIFKMRQTQIDVYIETNYKFWLNISKR